jgi:translation initiation factor eIF-2B subunit delta
MLLELENDNKAGANELINKALTIIKYQINLIQNPDKEINDEFMELAKRIVNSRPSMAPLINTIGYILQDLIKINKRVIEERMDKLKDEKIARNKTLERNFQDFLNKRKKTHYNIMLISYSSTIINLLIKFHETDFEFFVLESRPLLEGHKTAEILSKYFKTNIIIDAAAGKFIDQIDFVLIGVDSILKNGSIINKIGTLPLAVLANSRNVEVYAIADSFKYNLRSHFDREVMIEMKPIEEIYKPKIENDLLKVFNYYFDITSSKYINGIISNYGILSVKDFLEKATHDLPIEWFKYFLNNLEV